MAETVKVKYVGRYAEVLVPLPDGTTVLARKGEALAVPGGDFAAGLLVQEGNWKPVGADAKDVAAEAVAAVEASAAQNQTGG
jgi:hypothetical protein